MWYWWRMPSAMQAWYEHQPDLPPWRRILVTNPLFRCFSLTTMAWKWSEMATFQREYCVCRHVNELIGCYRRSLRCAKCTIVCEDNTRSTYRHPTKSRFFPRDTRLPARLYTPPGLDTRLSICLLCPQSRHSRVLCAVESSAAFFCILYSFV